MKRRKHNIMLTWWPDDGWITNSNGWITLSSSKTFCTSKIRMRYALRLMSAGKNEIIFLRRVPGGWMTEQVWEKTI